jgi:hypothetical protein
MGDFTITAEAGGPVSITAPNVTATLTSISGEAWSHLTVPVFNGVITLPTTDPHYSEFGGVNVALELSNGEVYQLGGFYKPPSGTTISYSLAAYGVPLTGSSVAGCTLHFKAFNSVGLETSPTYEITSVTLPALSITGVSGSESTGSRWFTQDTRQVHSVVPVAITASVYPLTVTIWTNHPSGSVNGTRRWHGWFTLTGASTIDIGEIGSKTELYTPLADESWTATVEVGAIDSDVAPSGAAVTSSSFSVSRIQNPASGLITTITVPAGTGPDPDFPYDVSSPDGIHYWSLPSITVNTSSAYSATDVFAVVLTAQDLDAAGSAIGVEHIYGTPLPIRGTLDFGKLDGPYGDEADPARSDTIAGVRLKVYLVNRIDQTTSSWQNTSARTLQATLDVVVAVGGAVPDGAIPSDRLDAATLDPTLVLRSSGLSVNSSNLANVVLNPDFESDFVGWVTDDAFITSTVYTGTKACRLDPTVNGDFFVYEERSHGCRPTDEIYAEAYIGSDAGVGSGGFSGFRIIVRFYDAADVQVGTDQSAPIQGDTSAAWVLNSVLATAPSGASAYRIILYGSSVSPPAGKYWYVDNVFACRQTPTGPGTQPNGRGGVQVRVAGPIYTDVSDNLNIQISSDFVVSGGALTQNIVDLAKASNFGTEFTKSGGLFIVNAIAVNKLVAGDALFAGQATFAYSGGGKVTINSSGLTMVDHNTSPNSTLTISSAGMTVARGNNSVQVTSSGVFMLYNSTVLGTFDTNGVTIEKGSNSVEITSSAVTVASGSNTVTITSSSITLSAGGPQTVISSSSFVAQYNSSNSVTIQSGSVVIKIAGLDTTIDSSGGIPRLTTGYAYVHQLIVSGSGTTAPIDVLATVSFAAAAGGVAIPATCLGFLPININGVTRKIAYF